MLENQRIKTNEVKIETKALVQNKQNVFIQFDKLIEIVGDIKSSSSFDNNDNSNELKSLMNSLGYN